MNDVETESLEALNELEKLVRVAEDPDAYTISQFDSALARVCNLLMEWGDTATGQKCDEVRKAFEHALKLRRICQKHDLIPRSKLIELEARLQQAEKARSIGPADPDPPPPPTLTWEDVARALELCTGDKSSIYGNKIDQNTFELIAGVLNEAIANKAPA